MVNREATLKSIPPARLNCFLKPGMRLSGNVPLACIQLEGRKICPSRGGVGVEEMGQSKVRRLGEMDNPSLWLCFRG